MVQPTRRSTGRARHPNAGAVGREVNVELTVAAIPVYFGSIGAEYAWLRRHAAERGATPGDYEWRDTIASLTMGVGSLVAPIVAQKLLGSVTPGRGRYAKALLGIAAGGIAVATIADAVSRSEESEDGTGQASRIGTALEPDDARYDRWSCAAQQAGAQALRHEGCRQRGRCSGGRRRNRHDHLVGHSHDGGEALEKEAGSRCGNRSRRPSRPRSSSWDFIYYWNHRFMHESRYMWAVHVVHHSSERYNLSTALRQPVADALGTFLPQGALCLAGFQPSLISSARGINLHLPVLDPHRGDRPARPAREGSQHAVAPPRAPRESTRSTSTATTAAS